MSRRARATGCMRKLSPDIDDAKLRVADINGDGLADVAYQGAGDEWWYRLNTGSGFAAAVSLGSYTGPGASRNRFLDVDRDGDADFIYPSGSVWYARKWRGDRFGPASATAYPAKYARSSSREVLGDRLGDFDGDGKVESFTGDSRDHGTQQHACHEFHRRPAAEHVITGITNGFGARTTVNLPVRDRSGGRASVCTRHGAQGRWLMARRSSMSTPRCGWWPGVESSARRRVPVPGGRSRRHEFGHYRYGGLPVAGRRRGGLRFSDGDLH